MQRLTISFPEMISAKILSLLLESERKHAAISMSSLYSFKNPVSRNCAEGNKSSNLVPGITRLSELAQTSF